MTTAQQVRSELEQARERLARVVRESEQLSRFRADMERRAGEMRRRRDAILTEVHNIEEATRMIQGRLEQLQRQEQATAFDLQDARRRVLGLGRRLQAELENERTNAQAPFQAIYHG